MWSVPRVVGEIKFKSISCVCFFIWFEKINSNSSILAWASSNWGSIVQRLCVPQETSQNRKTAYCDVNGQTVDLTMYFKDFPFRFTRSMFRSRTSARRSTYCKSHTICLHSIHFHLWIHLSVCSFEQIYGEQNGVWKSFIITHRHDLFVTFDRNNFILLVAERKLRAPTLLEKHNNRISHGWCAGNRQLYEIVSHSMLCRQTIKSKRVNTAPLQKAQITMWSNWANEIWSLFDFITIILTIWLEFIRIKCM